MKQQMVELERIHFARAFPWVHLFRAFRLALDVRKMILGAAALLVLFAGLAAFSYSLLDFSEAESEALRRPAWTFLSNRSPILLFGWTHENLEAEIRILLHPAISIWQPARELAVTNATWSGAALRWTQILWALCVWSFFGTAISRMVAVQFAVDQRVSVKEALSFAMSKWLWVISAPVMPLAGVLGLWFGCVVLGWIGLIPGIGDILLGALWIIPLLLAFGILLLLLGLILGWPLMVATITTQGSDAFDGFSRSFDYVYSRFWHLIWFVSVALVYGLLMLVLVMEVTDLIMLLARLFVGSGLGRPLIVTGHPPGFAFWHLVVTLLLAGYAVSYFWSASTIIYFLLRQSEDASHLSEVYLPKEDLSKDVVQLAGVAASDQPVIERPAKHVPETRQPGSETDIHD